jgi:hypothetical protein
MGGVPSKIDDKVRAKIYKRVTLDDLRTRANLLPSIPTEIIYPIIHAKPISINFSISCSHLERGKIGDYLSDRSIIRV